MSAPLSQISEWGIFHSSRLETDRSKRSARQTLIADFFRVCTLQAEVSTIRPGNVPVHVEVDGRVVDHIPDFELTDGTGLWLADCRMIDELSPQVLAYHQAVAAAAQAAGLEYRLETDVTVRVEPQITNARMIWRCSKWQVHPTDLVRVLHHLDEAGQSKVIEVSQVCRPHVDGVAVIAAMACQGLIDVDISSGPLGPETRVTRRRA
jgi:hypothetical protein